MIRWGDPVLSELLAGAFLALLTLVWATLCLTAGKYGERFRLTPTEPAPPRWPSLSVCIPARDEEGRVGEAVRLALASDYPDLEVVVVDDRSRDNTGEEARATAARAVHGAISTSASKKSSSSPRCSARPSRTARPRPSPGAGCPWRRSWP